MIKKIKFAKLFRIIMLIILFLLLLVVKTYASGPDYYYYHNDDVLEPYNVPAKANYFCMNHGAQVCFGPTDESMESFYYRCQYNKNTL